MALPFPRKSQSYLIVLLGCLTGYYIWNEPLKRYVTDQNYFADPNLKKMSVNKPFINPITKISVLVAVTLGCAITYKYCFQHEVEEQKRKQMQEEAYALYDQLKEKEAKLTKVEPT